MVFGSLVLFMMAGRLMALSGHSVGNLVSIVLSGGEFRKLLRTE